MTLKFADSDCKFFAYLAVSLSGPQFDDDTKIHRIHKDKTVQLDGIDQTCIYVKYPIETHFLLEMRSNLSSQEPLVQAHHFKHDTTGKDISENVDVSRMFWGWESSENNNICEFNLIAEKNQSGCLIFRNSTNKD